MTLEVDIIRYHFYYQGNSPPDTTQIARKLNLTMAGVNEMLRRVLDRLRPLPLTWRGVSFDRQSYIIIRNDNEQKSGTRNGATSSAVGTRSSSNPRLRS